MEQIGSSSGSYLLSLVGEKAKMFLCKICEALLLGARCPLSQQQHWTLAWPQPCSRKCTFLVRILTKINCFKIQLYCFWPDKAQRTAKKSASLPKQWWSRQTIKQQSGLCAAAVLTPEAKPGPETVGWGEDTGEFNHWTSLQIWVSGGRGILLIEYKTRAAPEPFTAFIRDPHLGANAARKASLG